VAHNILNWSANSVRRKGNVLGFVVYASLAILTILGGVVFGFSLLFIGIVAVFLLLSAYCLISAVFGSDEIIEKIHRVIEGGD
jgi:hypothetical protein